MRELQRSWPAEFPESKRLRSALRSTSHPRIRTICKCSVKKRRRRKISRDVAITGPTPRRRVFRESFASAVFDKTKSTRKSLRNVWSDKLPEELSRTFHPPAKPIWNSRGIRHARICRANLLPLFLVLYACPFLFRFLFFFFGTRATLKLNFDFSYPQLYGAASK